MVEHGVASHLPVGVLPLLLLPLPLPLLLPPPLLLHLLRRTAS
jgi:hypothetical protein